MHSAIHIISWYRFPTVNHVLIHNMAIAGNKLPLPGEYKLASSRAPECWGPHRDRWWCMFLPPFSSSFIESWLMSSSKMNTMAEEVECCCFAHSLLGSCIASQHPMGRRTLEFYAIEDSTPLWSPKKGKNSGKKGKYRSKTWVVATNKNAEISSIQQIRAEVLGTLRCNNTLPIEYRLCIGKTNIGYYMVSLWIFYALEVAESCGVAVSNRLALQSCFQSIRGERRRLCIVVIRLWNQQLFRSIFPCNHLDIRQSDQSPNSWSEVCSKLYWSPFTMPRIENEIKLDFKDVLIRPKRSTLRSREEVPSPLLFLRVQ